MKNNSKIITSIDEFKENLNISDVRSSKLNEDNFEGRDKFETVVKLHQFLSNLIDNGKGDYTVQMEVEGYTYDFIDKIKIDDNDNKIYII
jgi:hypothetical protein